MNRAKLKNYAPQARREFIQAVTDRASFYGLTRDAIEPITEQGDVAIIGGKAFPRAVAEKRRRLEERIARHGFDQTMEALAYTWFNRFVAIRFMELHGYLDHGYRVLSNTDAIKATPEIVEHAEHVDLMGLDKQKVVELKLDGTKEPELYRMLLLAQCNALHSAMPFLFERIDDETELLLPDNLLHSDSIIRKLVNEIDEEDWQEVEIIGWLYQFYISEKKDQVIGKVVKSEDIPAATQLFTPNWIVKYLVQNSLGRQWMATYPDSPLRAKMEFYIEPTEQTPEVQAQLKAITPESLTPEELTLMDPACGSGHILVEAYDLLKDIYLERGYRLRDIPRLILTKNLFGLEIDDRAAQLAAFALMMKARADDRRIFDDGVQSNVLAIQESNGLNVNAIIQAFTEKRVTDESFPAPGEFGFMAAERAPLFAPANLPKAPGNEQIADDLKTLFVHFEHAKTFGSLMRMSPSLAGRLSDLTSAIHTLLSGQNLLTQHAASIANIFVSQAVLLEGRYIAVVTNPPYMGSKYYNPLLTEFIDEHYGSSGADLYSCFLVRNLQFTRQHGRVGMITIPNWMYLSSFEKLRDQLVGLDTIETLIDNGRGIFGSDFGSCAFVIRNVALPAYDGDYRRLFDKQGSVAAVDELRDRFLRSTPHLRCMADFAAVPGKPIGYWASEKMLACFKELTPLKTLCRAMTGMRTGDNARFLRRWTEVGCDRCGIRLTKLQAAVSGLKWFPYNKGGDFRRWYGNFDLVVNWEDDGREIKALTRERYPDLGDNLSWKITNEQMYFSDGITWGGLTISLVSFRWSDVGSLFDSNKGAMIFPPADMAKPILGLMNSSVVAAFLKILNPSLSTQNRDIDNLPILWPLPNGCAGRLQTAVSECLSIARSDWNSFETSWEFGRLPVLPMLPSETTIDASLARWARDCDAAVIQMRRSETLVNELCAAAYDLSGEVQTEVADTEIVLSRASREEDVRRLLSYCVGCAMGRYSLDKPGLIYAHSGNEGFDPSQYNTFPADEDGIVPVTEMDWFNDDAAHRFEEFVRVAWPAEHLEENLTFVADSLGAKTSEQPRDTIRRYFTDEFFKDHLKTYKRRPIYWLFSSGNPQFVLRGVVEDVERDFVADTAAAEELLGDDPRQYRVQTVCQYVAHGPT